MAPLHELQIRTDKTELTILTSDEIKRFLGELGAQWHVDTSDCWKMRPRISFKGK